MPVPLLTATRLLESLLAAPHAYESADGFARRVGLRSRHQLNRVLRREHLPSFRTLSALVRVVALWEAAKRGSHSMRRTAIESGLDPAWAYRTIRKLTGRPWGSLRGLSSEVIVTLTVNESQRAHESLATTTDPSTSPTATGHRALFGPAEGGHKHAA